MTDLITRLEGLSGPCRKCDAHIAVAIKYCPDFDINHFKPEYHDTVIYEPSNQIGRVKVSVAGDVRRDADVPKYTSSIDAALTLIPDGGWEWGIDNCSASIGCETIYTVSFGLKISVEHKSLPIAICIASLRAREAMKGTHHD